MRFFNRVHFDSPMSPCELEIYHQIKNVIGVNPTFYEFLLAIDADTVVEPLSLNRFVSAMNHDRKVLATCGETELANAKRSVISMMQVYEVCDPCADILSDLMALTRHCFTVLHFSSSRKSFRVPLR